MRLRTISMAILACVFTLSAQDKPAKNFSFFITSTGSGKGADLGGLAGADAHCVNLAKAAGAKKKKWAAYLSAAGENGKPAVNAKDRIGKGPWYNVKGELMAKDVAELHSDKNNLKKTTSLTEQGKVVNGRGDTPNEHDILTGSMMDGTLQTGAPDTTCKNWTSSSDGAAQVGHHDRQGGGANGSSWNSAHISRGCSQANLVSTGGSGRFYCFAK